MRIDEVSRGARSKSARRRFGAKTRTIMFNRRRGAIVRRDRCARVSVPLRFYEIAAAPQKMRALSRG